MKLTNFQQILLVIGVGLLVYFLFLRKKDNKESGFAQAPKGDAIKEGGANPPRQTPQPSQAQVRCLDWQTRCSGCFWNWYSDWCSSSGGCGSCGSRVTNPST